MLFIVNLIVVSYLFKWSHYTFLKGVKENTKWYFNHAIMNCHMVFTTIDDSFELLKCSEECHEIKPKGGLIYRLTGYENIELIMVTNMFILHSYHMFLFDNLRVIDYIHHIVMMIVLIMAYTMNVGIYMSYFLFFICGLPGMIDYGMLATGYDRREEKRINTYLNNYLRSPGIIFGLGMLWRDTSHISSLTVLMSFMTLFWNAQYFNYEVIKSYYF